jgi:thiosulfate dehydrogenase [quinone] large subunit
MSRSHALVRRATGELRKPRAVLVPLRLFIGLGWLRAGVEKLITPGWYDGSELTAYIEGQLEWSQEAFPFYGALMEGVFLPQATALGIAVMLAQLLFGLAILCGCLTNAALLGGMTLNVSFILAGVPDPSAFYIVIQLVLLFGGAGAIAGVDAWLGRGVRHPLLVAPTEDSPDHATMHRITAAVSAGLALAFLPFVSTLDPALVIEDPAMILVMMFLVAAAIAAVKAAAATDPARARLPTAPSPTAATPREAARRTATPPPPAAREPALSPARRG